MTVDQSIPFFDHAFLSALGVSIDGLGYSAQVHKPMRSDLKMMTPFRSDFFMVCVVNEGHLKFRVNFLEREMHKGQMLFVLPQTVFEMVEAGPDFCSSNLLVDRSFMASSGLHANGREASEFMSSEHQILQVTDEESKVLTSLLLVLEHQAAQSDARLLRQDIARNTFLALMLEMSTLYRKYRVEVKANASRKEELTLRFIQMLSAHFREERSVQFYADHLYVTAKYLSTAIKEVTTKSPGAFIDDAVITEAKILLANPAATIAEIADALNFSDQSFFGKYFKKHSGYAPSEYRQQYWS